ncbi:MAG: carboxypeptidase-like regulatory domain-containing protein [Balneolales bacterium]
MFKKLFIVLFSLVLFAPMAILAEDGTISGQITDKETEEILPGATVLLDGTQFGTSTDKDGMYAFTNVPKGEYTMNVTYIGYTDFTTSVQVEEGEDITLDIEMEPIS